MIEYAKDRPDSSVSAETLPKAPPVAVVVGGGPAGLMAAEQLAESGFAVDLYDRMPSVGRKILMAGKSGLNLTHSEPTDAFIGRYGQRAAELTGMVRSFDAQALRVWAAGLGVETFVGSSGRVFPVDFKAAPLVRAWVRRLRAQGVRFHMRHRWIGWDTAGQLCFDAPEGAQAVAASVVVLALGGGSWARLGSDGTWGDLLRACGAEVLPWRPSNCGFERGWSPLFVERFAGQPLKTVAASLDGETRPGEFGVSAQGVEGSLIYAFSAALRDRLAAGEPAVLQLDLLPGRDAARVQRDLSKPRGAKSLSTYLKKALGLDPLKIALLRELCPLSDLNDPARLATVIKALPLTLERPRPLDEAISTAGGVAFESLDPGLMLHHKPGVFCCGEMLDWEAPTGGYLLTACFATGRHAGQAAAAWAAQERLA
jgi:uncharacterized flavoprotein (TIGR03862 family)